MKYYKLKKNFPTTNLSPHDMNIMKSFIGKKFVITESLGYNKEYAITFECLDRSSQCQYITIDKIDTSFYMEPISEQLELDF